MAKKKGFTIVELAIVIAVIGILAAVMVPAFSGVITKAKRSADTQVVRMLNTAIQTDLSSKGLGKHNTMYDAIQACEEQGFSPDKIAAKSDLELAWESTTGNFVLVDMLTTTIMYPSIQGTYREYQVLGEEYKYFIVTDYNSKINDEDYLYSSYAYGDNWPEELVIHTGFDAGEVKGFKKITYNEVLNISEKVIIRTNEFATKLYVEGTNQTEISHYGYAGLIDINQVSSNTFEESGVAGRVKIKEGHFHALNGSTVYNIEASDNAIVSVDNSANAYYSSGNVNEKEVVREQANTTNNVDKTYHARTLNMLSVASSSNTIKCLHQGEIKTFFDFFHTYEVCTPCGYSLVTIYDANTGLTYKRVVLDEDGESVILPANVYTMDQVANDTFQIDSGSIELKTDNKGEIVSPAIYEDEELSKEQQKCKHNWLCVDNNDNSYGTHINRCSSCNYSYLTYHTYSSGVCTSCQHECDHKYFSYSGVECDKEGLGTMDCSTCDHVETRTFNANEHIWSSIKHQCLRNYSEAGCGYALIGEILQKNPYESVYASEANGEASMYYATCGDTISFWVGDSDTIMDSFFQTNTDSYAKYFKDINGNDFTYANTPNVIIQEGFTIIGSYAFSWQKNISKVYSPSTLEQLGNSAFYYSDIQEFIIPENSKLYAIGDSAFYSSELKYFYMPDTVYYIGSCLFGACADLTEMRLSNSLTSIPFSTFGSVFIGCPFSSITIPKNIKSIGSSIFQNARLLNDIYYEGTKAEWEVITKDSGWDNYIDTYIVHCTDGEIKSKTYREFVAELITPDGEVIMLTDEANINNSIYVTLGCEIKLLKDIPYSFGICVSCYQCSIDVYINYNGHEAVYSQYAPDKPHVEFSNYMANYTNSHVVADVIDENITHFYSVPNEQ